MAVKEIILSGKVADWSREFGRYVELSDAGVGVFSGEAVDVYKPGAARADLFGWDKSDYLLLSYRPKAFSSGMEGVREGIYRGTQQHANSIRGVAGGSKKWGDALKRCIYDGELRILQELGKVNWAVSKFSVEDGCMISGVEWLAREYPEWEVSHSGRPWRDYHNRPSREQFLAEMETIAASPDRIKLAQEYFDKRLYKVSNYGNAVENGVGGFVPRSAAYPYCRQSVWNGDNPELLGPMTEFAETLGELFRATTPGAWQRQSEFIKTVKPEWRVGSSPYTTLTYNRNFRTAAHCDAGDYRGGFGNLFCLRAGEYSGAVTIFPEWGVGVDMGDGDWMAMDVHEIHGNSAFTNTSPDFERLSLVAYAREDMAECGSLVEESLRREFLKLTKTPDRKTGIWPKMWESSEWKKFKDSVCAE